MTRTLTLVTLAVALGLDFKDAVQLVEELEPGLPGDDLEAGKVITEAARTKAWRFPTGS